MGEQMYQDDYEQFMADRQAAHGARHALGPSAAGKCYRQAAYEYLDVTPTNPRSTKRADLGTLLHLGWSARIRAQYTQAEREPDVKVQPEGLPRPGEADDVDWKNKVVTDLKSAKHEVVESFLLKGPYEDYWSQLEVYALGLRQMVGGDWTIRLAVMDMLTGELHYFERPADPEVGQALVEKIAARHAELTDVRDYLASVKDDNPALVDAAAWQFPREGRGPGRGMPCDYCPFLDACWPEPTSPDGTPQSATVDPDDAQAILAFITEYRGWADMESKAKQGKRDASVFLAGLDVAIPDPDNDEYEFVVKMVGGNPKDEPDCEAMAEKLESLGYAPIIKTTSTARYPRISRRKRPKQGR